MDMGFFTVIILLAIILGGVAAITFVFWRILAAIKNEKTRRVVFILMCILFLPAMLLGWSAERLTENERKTIPFNWSVHTRSRLIVISLIAYAVIYYMLFEYLFT